MAAKLRLDKAAAQLLVRALKLDGFLSKFGAEQAKQLFPASGLYRYPAGVKVIEQGEEGRDIYVIESGRVTIDQTYGTAGAELAALGPGDIFGEIGLLKDGVRVAAAVTAEPSRIFRLAFSDVDNLLKRNAALGAHLKSLASYRLGGAA